MCWNFLSGFLGPNFGTEFQVLISGPNFGGSNFSPSEAEIETPHRRDGSMDDIFIIVKIGRGIIFGVPVSNHKSNSNSSVVINLI